MRGSNDEGSPASRSAGVGTRVVGGMPITEDCTTTCPGASSRRTFRSITARCRSVKETMARLVTATRWPSAVRHSVVETRVPSRKSRRRSSRTISVRPTSSASSLMYTRMVRKSGAAIIVCPVEASP